jgi:flavin reductase (DIM6/NTAB) family NADH-FMN oxidoreductase RutF
VSYIHKITLINWALAQEQITNIHKPVEFNALGYRNFAHSGAYMSDQNYSFKALKETKGCVINIPTVKLISQVVGIGNTSGINTDKFKKFNLTQEKASCVKAPLIKECYANLECKVIDTTISERYNIFTLEVLKAWITPLNKRQLTVHHCGDGNFIADGKLIRVSPKKK